MLPYHDLYSKLFINGEWVDSNSKQIEVVENPATQETIAKISIASKLNADSAMEAACEAFKQWKNTTLDDRIKYITRLSDILKEHKKEIVELEIAEIGAPIEYAKRKMCDWQLKRVDTFIEVTKELSLNRKLVGAEVCYEPYGVVVALTPWNFPLGQIFQKIIPAMLMGNTVVLKPSIKAPLTSYLLAQCIHEAGFPKGVFNLLIGKGSELGSYLIQHPLADIVTFTGQTDIGQEIAAKAGRKLKKCILELGGKNPCIWLRSYPRDAWKIAVDKIIESAFFNAGQTCTALSRLIVPREIQNDILTLFKKELKNYKIGDPNLEETSIGPVINKSQYKSIREYIKLGLKEGAELAYGRIPDKPEGGYFIEPVIFTQVTNNMRIAREEVFGPVLSIISYDICEEAIKIANDTNYGLSACVFGDKQESRKVAMQIQAGNIFVNDASRNLKAPFGGYKESGLGRESGIEGLMEYVQSKSIFIN